MGIKMRQRLDPRGKKNFELQAFQHTTYIQAVHLIACTFRSVELSGDGNVFKLDFWHIFEMWEQSNEQPVYRWYVGRPVAQNFSSQGDPDVVAFLYPLPKLKNHAELLVIGVLHQVSILCKPMPKAKLNAKPKAKLKPKYKANKEGVTTWFLRFRPNICQFFTHGGSTKKPQKIFPTDTPMRR
jgi:hypothetical protein